MIRTAREKWGNAVEVSIQQGARILGINYKRIERAIYTKRILPISWTHNNQHRRGPKDIYLNFATLLAYATDAGWVTPDFEPAIPVMPVLSETEQLRLELQQKIAEIERLTKELEELKKEQTNEHLSSSSRVSSVSPIKPSPPLAAPIDADVVVSSIIPDVVALRKQFNQEQDHNHKIARWSDYERVTDVPELPTQLLHFARLFETHGIAYSSVHKQIDRGRYRVTGPYKVGKSIRVRGIDREEAKKALLYWAKTGKLGIHTIQTCTVASMDGSVRCPCHDIADHLDELIHLSHIEIGKGDARE